MGRPSSYCMSHAALAGKAGCSQESLRRYIAAGLAPPPADGGEPAADAWAAEARVWIDEHRQSRKSSRAGGAVASEDSTESVARWQKARADRAELDLAVQRRDLVPREEVVELASRAILAVRSRLNALVPKMQSRLENVPGHVVAEELQTEVDDICNGFAESMGKVHDSEDG